MAETTVLGRSEVRVSRLGLGVMIWGEASGLQRVMPAKSAYGGPDALVSRQPSKRALPRR